MRNKTKYITSAAILIITALVVASKLLTPYIFDAIFGAFAVIGTVEVARVFERSKNYNSIMLSGTFPAALYLGLVFSFLNSWTWDKYLSLVIGLVAGYFILSFYLTIALKSKTAAEMKKYGVTASKTKYAFNKAMNTLMIIIYPALLFISVIMLNHFADLNLIKNNETIASSLFPMFVLVECFAITMITDAFAMVGGTLLKGPKLCPRISPNKHVSGAICGLIGGISISLIVFTLFNLNEGFRAAFELIDGSIWFIFFVGFICSVFCQVGDIFASFLKRRARVKDYGTIFPGHGGVMDRYDSVIVVAPIMLLFMLVMV